MYKINIFDEAFFFLLTVVMVTEDITFPVFIATTLKETNSFITIMWLIKQNYPRKTGVKQIKLLKNIACMVYLLPHL